ncbi:16S rRNA (uracil(1498)-N(3))-methyltransferase [Teredinibacter turnerae]|uniref:16S rRNA (uracil(1498)-N(3))-methyltransferase n=1 Tax=Teredinibacter turnerae TaxID=2426 RepID=UPI000360BE5A|nr:16S rRNA (uracil(1498)-N(3))-methyltransferase [Teredinibacter turnerae]
MRVPRIYTPQILRPEVDVVLEETASHHLLKVLRMETGRELILFNGQGGEYRATITAATKKAATVTVSTHDPVERESPLVTELAVGISRGDRFDWVLQKATELGISRIVPLFSERSEVKLSGERLEKRLSQWQKVVIGACEQCQRNTLPELTAPQSVENYATDSLCDLRFVLHHRSAHQLSQLAAPASVALLVGPEGGLSDAEIQLAENAGFSPLALGPRVLRTETAPLVALSVVQATWGDF